MITRPFAFAILLMLALLFGCQQEPFDGVTDAGGKSDNSVGSANEDTGAPRAEILTASLEASGQHGTGSCARQQTGNEAGLETERGLKEEAHQPSGSGNQSVPADAQE